MRVRFVLAVCLTTIIPSTAPAEDGTPFPTLPPIRVGDFFELRASTARRGLAMLPRCVPPSRPIRSPVSIGVGIGGGIGGGLGGVPVHPFRPAPLSERLAPSGVEVIRAKGLEGETARAQDKFAMLFPEADPDPLARVEHFAWLPHYDDHPVAWNSGWRAEIVRVEAATPGAWRIVVRMQPRLRTTGLKTLLADFVEETYRLDGESLELIGSDAETPKPKSQVFPLHL
jgi:hypothetical protein